MQRISSPLAMQVGMYGVVFCLLCGVPGAVGQTLDQLGLRFKRVIAFEIRPGIDMFPTFAVDGAVCRMIVERREYADSTNDFDNTISTTLATRLVDELVPALERGKPSKYLSTDSYIAGGGSFIKQDYENVSVGMYGSSRDGTVKGASAIVITWRKRACPSARDGG